MFNVLCYLQQLRKLFFVFLLMAFSTASAIQVPDIIKEVLPQNKIKVLLLSEGDAQIVAFSIIFRNAGTAFDPKNKEGLAKLVSSSILYWGVEGEDTSSILNDLRSSGIKFNFDVDKDNFYINVTTLRSNLGTAFSMLKKVLSKSRFEEDVINATKDKMKVDIKTLEESPDFIAKNLLLKSVFGSHPYGSTALSDSVKSIDRISQADIQNYMTDSITRINLIISCSGGIDSKSLAAYVDDSFSWLPLSTKNKFLTISSVEDLPNYIKPFSKKESHQFKYKDLDQNVYMFALPALHYSDPKIYQLFVLNHILGGGVDGLLFSEVRGKSDLVYGIGTRIVNGQYGSFILGKTAASDGNIQKVVAMINAIIINLQNGGITQEMLDIAKNSLKLKNMEYFITYSGIASLLSHMSLYGLDKNLIFEMNNKIDLVTLEDLNVLAKEMFNINNMLTANVGRKSIL